MIVLWQCWDDTYKSRSVIKFVYRPTLARMFHPACWRVATSSLFFLPSVRSVLVVAQSLFVCLCTIHVSVVSRLRSRSGYAPSGESISSPLVRSMSCWTHLFLDRRDCERVQRRKTRIVNYWISELSRVRKSSRVRVHQYASSLQYILQKKNERNNKFEMKITKMMFDDDNMKIHHYIYIYLFWIWYSSSSDLEKNRRIICDKMKKTKSNILLYKNKKYLYYH